MGLGVWVQGCCKREIGGKEKCEERREDGNGVSLLALVCV